MRKWWLVLALIFAFQLMFWWHSVNHHPNMEIVPAVPSEVAVKALSFGDAHAFFRVLGLSLQGFGDSYGRFTPLKDYDFRKLYRWFVLLDSLDNRSNYIPALASYYYSQTQNVPDVSYVVRYLQQHSEGRLEQKWWWRAQAVYLARHKLKDLDWALRLAQPLQHTKNVPLWVNQLPAFIHEARGEFDAALAIMEHIQKYGEDLPAGEINFIRHFITERIGALGALRKAGNGSATGNSDE